MKEKASVTHIFPQSLLLLLLLSLTDIEEPVDATDLDLDLPRDDVGETLSRFLCRGERDGECESPRRLRGEAGDSLRPRGERERESLDRRGGDTLLPRGEGGEGERLSLRGE